MAKDLHEIAAKVRDTGQAVEVPEEGVAIVPLESARQAQRAELYRQAKEMGRRLQLDIDAAAIIREARDERTRRQQENLGLR